MTMSFEIGQHQHQQMEQRPSPTLITFAQILALSSQDLQQLIHQEIGLNPALELVEHEDICRRCGTRLLGELCLRCDGLSEQRHEADEEHDPFNWIAAQVSLTEALMHDLVALLPTEDHFIADYLCGSLNESGLLDTTTTRAIAKTLGVEEWRVVRVLEALQSVGPLGVGARSIQECLLLQLRRWEELGEAPALVRPIVEHFMSHLGKGQYGYIASRLGVTYEEVIKARDFIRQHLRPFPVPDLVEGNQWCAVSDTPFIAPDIVISEVEGQPDEYEISIVESWRTALRIDSYYLELAEQVARARAEIKPQDASHVTSHVESAAAFVSHIRERRHTMERVALYVIKHQREFLRHGWRELRPMTRAEVAETLNLHESTISRAVSDKYVMLPGGQVIPFSKFFQAALSVQDLLREMIDQEEEPLTDSQLADSLEESGYYVARRTVAKYRNQMGILPSSLR
ncbi:MAG: RNA polymerase sigma-54 factor [Ardenticatenales bacterium]|nr:RNA polymerase sigma-54 factor [Ardenticatenales bacterium]